MMIRTTIVALLWFASAASLCAAKKGKSSFEGAISGVVLTEDGKPASNFSVCTQMRREQGAMQETQTCCNAKTNSEGQFVIEHVSPGTYSVLATNAAEGYSVENQSPGQKVTLSEESPRPSVRIQIHSKGAVVDALITDKRTGKPLNAAVLEFTGIDCEAVGSILQGDKGHYYLDIPTNCNVVVIARKTGYRGWVYTDATNAASPLLRLQAGERKLFDIRLEPLPKESSRR